MLPLLLSVLSVAAPQGADWCGLDISKAYVTQGQPQVALVFEPEQRRVFASLVNGEPLGVHALGYLAEVTPVDPETSSYAIDIVWDAAHGALLRGQSLVVVDGGEVRLDEAQTLMPSSAVRSDDVTFTDAAPQAAEARWPELSGLDIFTTRYSRIAAETDYLFVLPDGRRVVLANGDGPDNIVRGWILPTDKENGWLIRWDDPASAPDPGESFSEFRLSGGDIALRVQNYRRALFRKQEIGNSAVGDQRSRKLEALQAQLLKWSQAQDEADAHWNGWVVGSVYKLKTQAGFGSVPETYIWVEPETEEVFLATMLSSELVKDRSARGRVVKTGELLDGSLVTDVVWEGVGYRGSFRVEGTTVFAMEPGDEYGAVETYELLQGTTAQDFAKHFEFVLPQPEVSADELPYLEPGSVYKGPGIDRGSTAHIFILDNGRDMLMTDGGNGSFNVRGVLVPANFSTDDGKPYMAFLEYPGRAPDHPRVFVRWNREGSSLQVASNDRAADGRFELVPEGAPLLLASLKQKYGFWTED